MRASTVGALVQVIATRAAAAIADGTDNLAFAVGRPDRGQVGVGMLAEDLLDPVHDSTPRMSWLSLLRESSRPWVVMCR